MSAFCVTDQYSDIVTVQEVYTVIVIQGLVSWRPTTIKWWQFSQSNRHSSIGTRQTKYHEAWPSSANKHSYLTSSFEDDGNASWYSVCWVLMVEWRLNCENCHHVMVVGLHDTSPRCQHSVFQTSTVLDVLISASQTSTALDVLISVSQTQCSTWCVDFCITDQYITWCVDFCITDQHSTWCVDFCITDQHSTWYVDFCITDQYSTWCVDYAGIYMVIVNEVSVFCMTD